jgi:hypothetical protein
MTDKYILIAENPNDEDGELLLETYTKNLTLEFAKSKQAFLNERSLGKIKIAKITIEIINN